MDRNVLCYRSGNLIAVVPLSDYGYGQSLKGLTDFSEVIDAAQFKLARSGIAQAPFEGIDFVVEVDE